MEITLANQLALAYPSLNMIEVLELVGNKVNIGTFRPGIGTGGYCIPLSSMYWPGRNNPSELLLLKETIRTDDNMPHAVASLLRTADAVQWGVLGISLQG